MKRNYTILIFLLLFFILGIYSSGCKKDKYKNLQHGIKILNQMPDTLHVDNTVHVQFSVLQEGLDSVIFNINGYTYSLAEAMKYRTFEFRITMPGNYVFFLEAYYADGFSAQTSKVYLTIIEYPDPPLPFPKVNLNVKNSAGYKYTYINDSVDIAVVELNGEHLLDGFVRAALYLNDDSVLFTKEKPFVFKNIKVTNSFIEVGVYFTDTAGRRFSCSDYIRSEYNTPPDINKFELPYGKDHFFSYEDPSFYLSIKDNKCIQKFFVYKDDILVKADTSYNRESYSKYIEFGYEEPGHHSLYTVAGDERGETTVSDTFNYDVYKSIVIDKEIIDLENDKDKDLIFALSMDKLFIIDPSEETLSNVVLPYPNSAPLAMDYVPQNKRVYVGFESGKVYFYSLDKHKFFLAIDGNKKVTDIEIDYDLNVAVLIRDKKVEVVELNTLESVISDNWLGEKSSLMLNRADKRIIVADYKYNTPEKIYKYEYSDLNISLELTKEYDGFYSKIYPSQDGSEFVLFKPSYTGSSRLCSFDSENLTIKGDFNKYCYDCCYSNDGSKLFVVGNSKIVALSTTTFMETGSYEGLGYGEFFMRPNIDGSKMVLIGNYNGYETIVAFQPME